MTFKKQHNKKNTLFWACRQTTPCCSIFGPNRGNRQTQRGPPRKQYEEGVEVPTRLLKRVMGHNGEAMKDIISRFKCMVKVFKKDRPTPLVHCLAWTKGDLQGAIAQIRYLVSKVPEPVVSLTCALPYELDFDCIYDIKRHYPSVDVHEDYENSTITFTGTRHWVNLARNDLRWATPEKVTNRVAGPAGLLIGAFGVNIGTVRQQFCVDVKVCGNEATIVGTPLAVEGAVQWYRDLIASHGSRLRW